MILFGGIATLGPTGRPLALVTKARVGGTAALLCLILHEDNLLLLPSFRSFLLIHDIFLTFSFTFLQQLVHNLS